MCSKAFTSLFWQKLSHLHLVLHTLDTLLQMQTLFIQAVFHLHLQNLLYTLDFHLHLGLVSIRTAPMDGPGALALVSLSCTLNANSPKSNESKSNENLVIIKYIWIIALSNRSFIFLMAEVQLQWPIVYVLTTYCKCVTKVRVPI